jgi:hypothetical protein
MVIMGTFLFIVGCFLADTARQYDKEKHGNTFCGAMKSEGKKARCEHLICATVRTQQIMLYYFIPNGRLVHEKCYFMRSMLGNCINRRHLKWCVVQFPLVYENLLQRDERDLKHDLRRISSPRTKLLAARCDCMHEHFHPITMLNS